MQLKLVWQIQLIVIHGHWDFDDEWTGSIQYGFRMPDKHLPLTQAAL